MASFQVCRIPILFGLLLVLTCVLNGCSKTSGPEPVEPAKAAKSLGDVFKKAPADAAKLAEEVSASVEANKSPAAFVQLQALSARQDLTPEQRAAVGGAIVSLNADLRKAAENGNKEAAEVLESYRRGK